MDRRKILAKLIRNDFASHPFDGPWLMVDRVIERFEAECPGVPRPDEDEVFLVAAAVQVADEPPGPN